MAKVVEQRRYDEPFTFLRLDDFGEPLVVSKMLEKQEGQAVDAERVLEPRVDRGRINQRDEAKLAYAGQSPELRAVDDAADPLRQRHIQLGWYPDHPPSRVKPNHFRNI